jgi:hypothetical protein
MRRIMFLYSPQTPTDLHRRFVFASVGPRKDLLSVPVCAGLWRIERFYFSFALSLFSVTQ